MSRTWLVASVVLTVLLAACGGAPQPGGTDNTLVIAVDAEPTNLNPIFGDVYGSIYGDHYPMFSSLLRYDQKLEPAPDLAAELPTISPDGRQVTVKLRQNATWHDGQPVTADDVVFTYRSIMDPQVATKLRSLLYDSLAAVDALDRYTVRFTLNRIDPAFLGKLTTGIVPAHLLEGQDLNTARFNLDPVGSGPFVFQELRPGERMVLTANQNYYGGKVGIDRLVMRFVEDQNSRASQLQAGTVDVDAAGLPPRVADRFRNNPRYQVVTVPGDMLTLMLPTNNPLFADAPIRRAIGMAIDRQQLVNGLEAGQARVVNGPFSPGSWAYTDIPPTYDPAAAQRALAAAGWAPGPDGVLTRGGQRFGFDLIYGHGNVDDAAALAVRDMLAKIGIAANPVALEYAEQQKRIAAGAAALEGLGNTYDPDLDLFNTYHSSLADNDPAGNPAQVKDPAIDAAIMKGRGTLDRQVRAQAYRDLQRSLAEQGSWQDLLQVYNNYVVTARVKGVEPQVREGHNHGFSRGLLWNLRDWSMTAP